MNSEFSSLSESSFIPTNQCLNKRVISCRSGSHLFQRVASFLLKDKEMLDLFKTGLFSSLSESSFIPTLVMHFQSRCFQLPVLISFREQLHSYFQRLQKERRKLRNSSHLFQRVASFLLEYMRINGNEIETWFSSLSESSFIPTGV